MNNIDQNYCWDPKRETFVRYFLIKNFKSPYGVLKAGQEIYLMGGDDETAIATVNTHNQDDYQFSIPNEYFHQIDYVKVYHRGSIYFIEASKYKEAQDNYRKGQSVPDPNAYGSKVDEYIVEYLPR